MSDSIPTQITDLALSNDTLEMLTFLEKMSIIDIGIIGPIDDNGRASVLTSKMQGGKQVIYEDVELLFIGNTVGALNTDCAGSLCLLFAPVTFIYDTKTMCVEGVNEPYSLTGLKAIPLSNGTNTTVDVGFDSSTGNFILGTATHSVCIGEGAVIVSAGDNNTFTFSADGTFISSLSTGLLRSNILPDGTVFKVAFDGDGKPTYMYTRTPDGTETTWRNGTEEATPEQIADMLQYEKWTWIEVHNADGSYSMMQTNGDGADGALWTEEYNADGSRTVTQWDGSGNELWKQEIGADATTNETITKTRTIAITDGNGQEQIHIEEADDGKFVLKTKSEISISVDGTDMIEIKNNIASLKQILDEIVDNVKTFSQNVQSIDTVGSPASHSAGPGIIANMITLQSKLDALKSSKIDKVFK